MKDRAPIVVSNYNTSVGSFLLCISLATTENEITVGPRPFKVIVS